MPIERVSKSVPLAGFPRPFRGERTQADANFGTDHPQAHLLIIIVRDVEATMILRLLSSVAVSSLLIGAAVAQSNSPSPPQQPAATTKVVPSSQQAAANDGKGIAMAKSATFGIKFVSPKPADIMTSKLIGADVYNNQNEKLGQIEDLSIENGKTLTGVVVSVGGFLGIGERYVLVDPATIVVDDRNGTWRAFVDTSKDTLKGAPEFHYKEARS